MGPRKQEMNFGYELKCMTTTSARHSPQESFSFLLFDLSQVVPLKLPHSHVRKRLARSQSANKCGKWYSTTRGSGIFPFLFRFLEHIGLISALGKCHRSDLARTFQAVRVRHVCDLAGSVVQTKPGSSFEPGWPCSILLTTTGWLGSQQLNESNCHWCQ